jgi:hypothetical protein
MCSTNGGTTAPEQSAQDDQSEDREWRGVAAERPEGPNFYFAEVRWLKLDSDEVLAASLLPMARPSPRDGNRHQEADDQPLKEQSRYQEGRRRRMGISCDHRAE